MGKIYKVESVKDVSAVTLSEAEKSDEKIFVPESAQFLTILGGTVEIKEADDENQ